MSFGSVVSLGVGINNEGFDMLGNVLLRTGFWLSVFYEIVAKLRNQCEIA